MRTVAALILATVMISGGLACAQTPDQSQRFDAVSIKPMKEHVRPGSYGGPGTAAPERLTLTNVSLRALIARAYPGYEDWIEGPHQLDDKYNLEAVLAPGVTREQLPTLFANALADTFQLRFHTIKAAKNGFELGVAPGGPKLSHARLPLAKDASGASKFSGPGGHAPGAEDGSWGATNEDGIERFVFRQCSLDELIGAFVMRYRVTPIIDRTGLTGKFDFKLDMPLPAPQVIHLPPGFVLGNGALADHPELTRRSDESIPSPGTLSSQLQKQLGLKLVPAKVIVDSLIVDYVNPLPDNN